MAQDFSIRAVAHAEQMIADGELSLALERLKTAAGNVPAGHPEAAALFVRMRDLADSAARRDPSCAPLAREVEDVVERRRAYIATWRGGPSTSSAQRSPVPWEAESRDDEPWFYAAAKIVASVAVAASIVCAIGGLVVGVAASKYTGGDGQTHHRAGVVVLGIVSGLLSAALWLGVGAALNLLVDNGRMLRASRDRSG